MHIAQNRTGALVLLVFSGCTGNFLSLAAGGLQVWGCGVLVLQRLQCAKASSEDCRRRTCDKGAWCASSHLSICAFVTKRPTYQQWVCFFAVVQHVSLLYVLLAAAAASARGIALTHTNTHRLSSHVPTVAYEQNSLPIQLSIHASSSCISLQRSYKLNVSQIADRRCKFRLMRLSPQAAGQQRCTCCTNTMQAYPVPHKRAQHPQYPTMKPNTPDLWSLLENGWPVA